MTKDRRLGRGLAALLGTPLEDGGEANVAKPQVAGNGPPPTAHHPSAMNNEPPQWDGRNRAEVIRALNGQAHVSAEEARGATPAGDVVAGRAVVELAIGLIDNNPFQPRRQFNEDEIASLAESLKEHEQLQPILVRRIGERYQLISGERRLRAATLAGMKSIRAEIRQADDRLVAELAIIENLQRKDLNSIEKALSFKRYLSEHSCTQEDLARRLKIDRSTIANLMRLLELPESVTDAVQADRLTAGHARSLLPLDSEEIQEGFARRIIAEGWSVRETERRVAEEIEKLQAEEEGTIGIASLQAAKRTKSDHLASLEQEMRMSLGTKVEIKQSGKGRGKIVITFANAEEFERLRRSLASTSGTNSARKAG